MTVPMTDNAGARWERYRWNEAMGCWYDEDEPLSDEEVSELLNNANAQLAAAEAERDELLADLTDVARVQQSMAELENTVSMIEMLNQANARATQAEALAELAKEMRIVVTYKQVNGGPKRLANGGDFDTYSLDELTTYIVGWIGRFDALQQPKASS